MSVIRNSDNGTELITVRTVKDPNPSIRSTALLTIKAPRSQYVNWRPAVILGCSKIATDFIQEMKKVTELNVTCNLKFVGENNE